MTAKYEIPDEVVELLGEPVVSMYQARDGSWHSFVDEKHKANTIASGEWVVRDFYAIKDQQP